MSSFRLLTPAKLSAAAAGDMEVIRELDKHGLLPAPGEDAPAFARRLSQLAAALGELEAALKKHPEYEVAPGMIISSKHRIGREITGEALQVTSQLYDVRPEWVPGFFANESGGIFWGGCALSDPASNLTLFIIRKAFQKKQRILVYNRRELMAHELTHAAHQALNDWFFEEYFAYRTASSPLRKFFGCCFIRQYDALGFLLPVLLLPVAQALNIFTALQMPMIIFWILAAVYPLFLTVRTLQINSAAARAEKFLRSMKIRNPAGILFRMTVSEIKMLARKQMPHGSDLRWQLLNERINNNRE